MLFTLLVVALAVAASVFLAERPGSLTLVWQGWRIDTSAVAALGLLIAGFGILSLVWGLAARLIGTPRRVAERKRNQRQLAGHRALGDGLVAIAAGDGAAARRQLQRAEKMFRRSRTALPPLARLIEAQVAQLHADEGAAGRAFDAMLEHKETEFLGLRGKIVQAQKAGDHGAARLLTERARALRPAAPWVLHNHLGLQTQAGEWRAALDTLTHAVKHGALPPQDGRRQRARLFVARGRQAVAEDRQRDALQDAKLAWRLESDFAPAAIDYAERLAAAGRRAKAFSVIEAAWRAGGHPDLIRACAALAAEEPPARRLERIERLIGHRPDAAEGHVAAAAIALDAQLWGEARRHLEAAGASGPGPWSRPLCRLMATLEEGQRHDHAAARLWLARASEAAEPPCWCCVSCGTTAPTWTPLCPQCRTFGTLDWGSPPRGTPTPTSAEPAGAAILAAAPPRRIGPAQGDSRETAARDGGG
jgi:HemY protein